MSRFFGSAIVTDRRRGFVRARRRSRCTTNAFRWRTVSGTWIGGQSIGELQTEAMKDDWRPTVSYIANLSRIGEQLLGTNKSWETLYAWMPPETIRSSCTAFLSPQYPWYWSGVVSTRTIWSIGMHSELPSQIAGSAEVKPVVAFHEVSKWYGNVIGINKLTLANSCRRNRFARAQRRGQIDAVATGNRATLSQPG